MFTGIVTEVGTVDSIDDAGFGKRLAIGCDASRRGLAIGDSVAVNGVCLTVVALNDSGFAVDAVDETLRRSNLGAIDVGSAVNLERPMLAGGRFDGHVVQGHADGVGTIVVVGEEGTARRLRIAIASDLAVYVVEKGSVAVDGVSLTITAVSPLGSGSAWFEVVIIPYTLRATVLGRREVGSLVNLEVDVIAKYVERMLEAQR